MKKYILILFLFPFNILSAQNIGGKWCFGDSAGIDFTAVNPGLFASSAKSRGSSVSISDSSGQLLFYAYTRATVPGNTTLVKNRSNVLMQNGSNLVGSGWYLELIVVPVPNDSMRYYLFSAGVSNLYGLFYSVIDMTLDSGRGAVTQKNLQLQSYAADDCVLAIKHGNGRDWWVISRRTDVSNNEFNEYLVTPSGVSGPYIQTAGSPITINSYRMAFSNSGSKLIGIKYTGLIEEFSFDRCTGAITYDRTIAPNLSAGISPALWSCAFSQSDRYLYISSSGNTTYLHQIDLWDVNPWANHDTIWSFNDFSYAGGALKLALDGKIYFACAWNDGVNFNYPYPDSVFNMYNNNLSVINYPDSPGIACGFSPFSFNLGGGRTYWGLPNNSDYEMGPDTNSICDTIVQVGSMERGIGKNGLFHVFYHPGWEMAFVNAERLMGKRYLLQIFDLNGKEVFKEDGSIPSSYFTRDINCESFSRGMYVVMLQTEKERLARKFMK